MKIMQTIRKEIQTSGKTRYQIGQETGADQAILCRIMQGGSCKAETAEVLLEYFGYELKKKKGDSKC